VVDNKISMVATSKSYLQPEKADAKTSTSMLV